MGRSILYIRVPVSSLVHKHVGIIYDRENASDFRVTDERQIGEIYFRKRQSFTETQIFPELKMEHLSQDVFDKVRKLIAAVNTTHPWLIASNDRILRDVNFIRREFNKRQLSFAKTRHHPQTLPKTLIACSFRLFLCLYILNSLKKSGPEILPFIFVQNSRPIPEVKVIFQQVILSLSF